VADDPDDPPGVDDKLDPSSLEHAAAVSANAQRTDTIRDRRRIFPSPPPQEALALPRG
jgi:hypothetical protein